MHIINSVTLQNYNIYYASDSNQSESRKANYAHFKFMQQYFRIDMARFLQAAWLGKFDSRALPRSYKKSFLG